MAAASLLLLAGAAVAQPCTPQWDTTAGNPGISGGYVAPIRAWNDGNGERVYIGGSFTAAGGSGANQYLSKWNPANNTWSPLGTGISGGFTNAFMTVLVPFNPGSGERLVAGGFFDTAGGVAQTASLAMWNGTTWEAMGTTWTGTTRGSIWSAASWNGRLYVGGGVVNSPGTIAGLPWAGLASWDGQNWATHISSMTAGTTPGVFSLQVFNDGSGEALYAIGRFTSINGVPGTGLIARWNGTSWSSVGGGLTSTSALFGLECSTIFDDGNGAALYVAGYSFAGTGLATSHVAKWNGTTWTSIGGSLGTGRITSIVPFNDGSGAKLYISGTAMPGFNYIARWEGSAWVPVGGGVTGAGLPPSNFPSVFGLGVAHDKLYAGGNFAQVNNQNAAGIAAWTGCTATSCYPNCDGSSNPPVLNTLDFSCFINRFAAGESYANCDGSTAPPALNVLDFSCFINKFAAGCS